MDQLDAGIRCFDLRAGYEYPYARISGQDGTLQAFHGNWMIELTFQEVFSFFYDWLDDHKLKGLLRN
jgi:hypothetical protein